MPTREAIVDTIIPKEIEKPIPVRTISTRTQKPNIHANLQENGNQPVTNRSDSAAVSAIPEESVKLSPQLSALARKEQAFRQREQALAQREKDLEAKLAEAEQYGQLKTKMASKDYSEAEKLGLNYEEYVQYKLKQSEGEDPNAAKFKSIEEELKAMKKGQEEKANQEYEETVSEYRKEIASLIASNPDFSSVKELKREDAVLQLILDSWEEDGEELSVEQAAKDIEDFLIDQGKKFSNLPKLKPVEEERKLPPPKPSVKTLTNQMQPTANSQPQKSLQHLSESERYAEARRRVMARRQQQGI